MGYSSMDNQQTQATIGKKTHNENKQNKKNKKHRKPKISTT